MQEAAGSTGQQSGVYKIKPLHIGFPGAIGEWVGNPGVATIDVVFYQDQATAG